MATDDRQILVTGTAPAPATWLVPGNGQIKPRSIFAHFDGSAAVVSFYPTVKVISDAGQTVGIYPCEALVAAGGSADVSWFPGAELDETSATGPTSETLLMDTRSSTGVTSTMTLASGVSYAITAQGTWSYVNHSLNVGVPEANALFPTDPTGRLSTQVGFDPETVFAYWSGSPPAVGIGHATHFQIDLGGGFAYHTPSDGTHSTPNASHTYTYQVTGAGSAATFKFVDAPGQYSDNYGYVQITIQQISTTSLPPAGTTNSILRASSGAAVWDAQPNVTETDLSLSNVTTANVSTAQHGFAPKAPNDATKFLDGTGAYSTPAGTTPVTTKGDLFGYDTAPNRIPVGANTTVLTADSTQALGLKWAAPATGGGAEIGYDQITSSVNITATTEAGATTIITCSAHTFDGAACYAEFYGVVIVPTTSGGNVVVALTESGTTVEWFGYTQNAAASTQIGVTLDGKFRFTPSAASHSYVVKAWASSTTGTPKIVAGAGGAGVFSPAFVRFVKA